MRAAGTASSLCGFFLLLSLGTLLVLSCTAQDFIFPPEREVTIPGQQGFCIEDPEAVVDQLSYLLGMEGKEHIHTLFPWAKGGKVMSSPVCDLLTPGEKVHKWPHLQTPDKISFCHLPQNYADLVMVMKSHSEVRCTEEGCCSRGLCHLQSWNLLARKATESPPACYEKGETDPRSVGFSGLIYKPCKGGDVICGRLLCTQAKVVPVLPDGSVILNLVTKSGIICWGTDYRHEMVTVQIPDVDKIRYCNPCGEGFLCFNKTCNEVSVFNVDCVSSNCMKGGICRGHRNCRCKQEEDPQVFKGPKDGESDKWKKLPRNTKLPVVMFLMRFVLLILSIGLAFLAKMISLWFV